MSFEIAVDIGGTFTDIVLRRDGAATQMYKVSTTPQDISVGIFNGLDLISSQHGLSRSGLLEKCVSFACGSTVATNAILEGKVARTALLCTKGFRDTLLIREGGKEDSYNIYMDYPPPYIPRRLTFGIPERISAEGTILRPLDEAAAIEIINRLRELDVEAVAISLLWSIMNPQHELRLGELLRKHLPGIPFSLSHQVNPTLREYRRTSAVAIDASLKPVVKKRLLEIETQLRGGGFKGAVTFVTSNGGRTSSTEIIEKPVYLCLSGPSAAPKAACLLAEMEGDRHGNVITIDMGGTSFDVSVSSNWETPTHREGMIDGHIFGVPSIDVSTIGAGGGSIGWVDAGGFLHVGPASAGANPGPACYDRGGARPTVTDANVVRGVLDASSFARGQLKINKRKAWDAIDQHIAKPLKLTVEEAANLMCVSVEQSMISAIEEITIRRGIDPREYLLVAGGAAAGVHAVAIARELGMKRVLVPDAAGVLSAYGICTGEIRFDFARSFFASSKNFDYEAVKSLLSDLKDEGTAYLQRMRVAERDRRINLTAEARYAGQIWQLTLPLPSTSIDGPDDLAAVVESFHQMHERVYAVRAPDDAIEFVEWNVQAIGMVPRPRLIKDDVPSSDPSPAQVGVRPVLLHEARRAVEVPVYDRERLVAGAVIKGPALIDAPLTAVFLPPSSSTRVTANGGLMIELLE